MVIAIDGPAGAGKSTVARAVARELGATYLDSGAMYRCVALAAARSGRPAAEVAPGLEIRLGERILLDGEDVTDAIRAPEVSDLASRVSADPAVRAALVEKQRALLAHGDWVAEGRDIGTVVAPDADVKVFLTASDEARAQRRAAELGEDPRAVRRELALRDERDATREHSPMVPAPDAVPVDTTRLSVEQAVEQVVTLAVEAQEHAPGLRRGGREPLAPFSRRGQRDA
jgi:cytidylate kinase